MKPNRHKIGCDLLLIKDVQVGGNLAVANILWALNAKLKDAGEPKKPVVMRFGF